MNGTIQFNGSDKIAEVDHEAAMAFISGEVAPRIADHYLHHGMPRRGLIRFTMTLHEHSGIRIIGPNLARRAGTASSAVERR